MPHPEPERRTNAPAGSERLLAGLTPEQTQAGLAASYPANTIAPVWLSPKRTVTELWIRRLAVSRHRDLVGAGRDVAGDAEKIPCQLLSSPLRDGYGPSAPGDRLPIDVDPPAKSQLKLPDGQLTLTWKNPTANASPAKLVVNVVWPKIRVPALDPVIVDGG
jgi:hypothetical protein